MSAKNNDIHAGIVESLLKAKHSEDVFVSECKIGQSWTDKPCRRLDAWVMPRSYSPFCCIGYEIKVSRQDFLHDDKMTEYLPYCHQMYVVAPDGVASPDELPAEIGLMKVSKNAKRLTTVKKAPFRQVTIPDSLFKYIIMSRADITSGYKQQNRLEAYRKFVEETTDRHKVGHMASRKIAKYVSELARERDNALKRAQSVEDVDAALKAIGIDAVFQGKYGAVARAKEVMSGIPDTLLADLDRVTRATSCLYEELKKKKGELCGQVGI